MTIPIRNPRTGQFDYEIQPLSSSEIAAVAQQLRTNAQAWQGQGLARRIEVLQEWRATLPSFGPEIIKALSLDTGRHLISTLEFNGLLKALDRWCQLAPELLQPEVERQSVSMPSVSFRSDFMPYPLVGIISPWNFPLTLSTIDLVPALLAGCSVLVKPSEITPRFIAPLQASIDAVPALAAVLRYLTGAGDTGATLLENVDAVCFTGSVTTGRKIAVAAAQRFIPAFLELGGKDPVIVTASADLPGAAATVLRASVLATGQACQSLERVYVDATIYAAFLDELVRQAEAVTLNYPDPKRGQLGPIIFAKQAEIIAGQLQDAVGKGAIIECGGTIETHGGGLWLRPTVLSHVDHSMAVMTEETFGPVIPVMAYQSIEEAITLANDSVYGLSAAVIAGSRNQAEAIGQQLEVGAVSINDGALTGLMYEAEKNSFKLSGMGGSRMGAAALIRFVRKRAMIVQNGKPLPLAAMDEANSPQ